MLKLQNSFWTRSDKSLQVCGLKWSHDDRELASGGNDNQLLVWNQRSQQPVLRLTEHTAAVKAIAWSPHQHGLVASGGGTADRCIKFWNTANGNMLNSVDTGSQASCSSEYDLYVALNICCFPHHRFLFQVCNLAWCKNVNELVSTHGYSQNQIMVWKYPSMSKVSLCATWPFNSKIIVHWNPSKFQYLYCFLLNQCSVLFKCSWGKS